MRHLITQLGVYTARPFAFIILGSYAAAWLALSPATLDWHAIATLATWFMTLLIQRTEHRDTQAIQLKLDELLHALGNARSELATVDEKEPEEIERQRRHMQRRE